MARAKTADPRLVEVIVTDEHMHCGECSATMVPIWYRSLEGPDEWFWWSCLEDSNHISCALPLPYGSRS
jgi:hypothetical protein